MIIRQAYENDAGRISYLIQKNTENVKENNYSKEQIEIWKKANSIKAIERQLKERTIFCAFIKDKLVGTIGLKSNEVLGLYVSYSKRGKGIGKILLKHLEKYAKENNIKSLHLTSTPSAVSFYTINGYEFQKNTPIIINGITFCESKMTKKLEE